MVPCGPDQITISSYEMPLETGAWTLSSLELLPSGDCTTWGPGVHPGYMPVAIFETASVDSELGLVDVKQV